MNKSRKNVPVGVIETQKGKTFLTADNIIKLKRIFPDEATYIEYMETLWVLRKLAEKACERPNQEGVRFNVNSPYFRIVRLSNNLIGALLQSGIHFGFTGMEVYHRKTSTQEQITPLL